MVLAKVIYQEAAKFPDTERFGLTNQMRRASVSVASNISEGHARLSTADFQRFISIAMGSVAEMETQVLLSYDLGFLQEQNQVMLLQQLDDIGKMLRGLHRALKQRANE